MKINSMGRSLPSLFPSIYVRSLFPSQRGICNGKFCSRNSIMGPRDWLGEDESAKEMLQRFQTERPFLLLPPFRRVPLRVGNVVEIVGPSPSAKTHILIQAAINCILPYESDGVKYGGHGHLVMFLDLDCCFDILRFSELLKLRILEANRSNSQVYWKENDVEAWNYIERTKPCSEELFALCMRRFIYIRCHDSFEFLASLKTLHYRLQKERDAHGIGVHFLMIDSIGAFHWVDRASSSFPPDGKNRKRVSLQSVSETVVQELRKLLLVHPMLLIAAKATILQDRCSGNKIKWNFRKRSSLDNAVLRNAASNDQQLPYREYMPSIWQSFVTHRILVRSTDEDFIDSEHQNFRVYLSQWIVPHLNSLDKFIVKDAGLSIIP